MTFQQILLSLKILFLIGESNPTFFCFSEGVFVSRQKNIDTLGMVRQFMF